jgi:hypothetical protein
MSTPGPSDPAPLPSPPSPPSPPSATSAVQPDFRLLFDTGPALQLLLSPDLTIVAVSNAHLAATMKRRDEVIGRNLFAVFPENPDDAAGSSEAQPARLA